jgi:hypothetical protein
LDATGVFNEIADISAPSGLRQLSIADLIANQITDLAPLANNAALSSGSFVYVQQDRFACAAQASNIQGMQNRGVTVASDCP